MTGFLSPLPNDLVYLCESLPEGSLGKQIGLHTKEYGLPSFEKVKFAVLGIKDARNNPEATSDYVSFDNYRKAFYSLYPGNWNYNIIDLGDIENGNSPEDTHFALKEIVIELLSNQIIPLILGAGQDLAYSQYRAYDKWEEMVNVVNVDHKFDLGNSDLPMTNKSYVGKMVVNLPYNLFNYSVIGYQSYFNAPQEISLMERLFFEAYRLGEVTANVSITEPVFRNADIVIMDATSIQNSEFSHSQHHSPNGFTGREICALSRYAGISNQVSSFGIYEIGYTGSSEKDAMLIAQIFWYFIEGVNFRIKDDDFDNENQFTTYQVPIEDETLTFKKSNRTERWWIELPNMNNVNNKLKKKTLLPCTYEEYLLACDQEIPERWMKARLKNEV